MNRIDDVFENTKQYIKYSSIAGALSEVNPNPPSGFWDDTIRPLDDSEYNLQDYVNALGASGFNSKMILHTFGIDRAPEDHLAASIAVWEELVDNYNATLGISENNRSEIGIYPNPVKEKLFLTGDYANKRIEVYDLLGKLTVSKQLNESENTINLSVLTPGVYVLKVKDFSNPNRVKIHKIVKD